MKRGKIGLVALLTLTGLVGGAAAQGLNTTIPSGQPEAAVPVSHDEKAVEIIEAYIEQIGGRELIASIKSTHTTGTVEIPMAGITGAIDMSNMAPGKMSMTMDLAGFGKTQQGYDGEIGWSTDPMNGPRLMSEKEVVQLADQADPAIALKYKQTYPTIEYAGETDFNGQRAHKIRLVRDNGKESFEYYSVDSGMMIGQENVQASPMGEIRVVTSLEDYKEFGGMKVPTTMIQQVGPQKIIITITSMEMNTVSPDAFERPDAVQALVEAKADAAGEEEVEEDVEEEG